MEPAVQWGFAIRSSFSPFFVIGQRSLFENELLLTYTCKHGRFSCFGVFPFQGQPENDQQIALDRKIAEEINRVFNIHEQGIEKGKPTDSCKAYSI